MKCHMSCRKCPFFAENDHSNKSALESNHEATPSHLFPSALWMATIGIYQLLISFFCLINSILFLSKSSIVISPYSKDDFTVS